VADFIVGVVVDVLGHVAIQFLKSSHVQSIAAVDSGDFAVLGSSQLRILEPKVGLDDFGGSQNPENSDVSVREVAVLTKGPRPSAQQPGPEGCGTRRHDSLFQKCAPIRKLLERTSGCSHLIFSFP
jgi:hypothetical protein